MLRSTALTWSWLNILTKKRYDALSQVYADMEEAMEHLDENMLKELGCREETMMIAMNRLEEFDSDAYEKELEKRGIKFLSIEDPDYPNSLKSLPDPPLFLYYKGSLDILNQPCIACVGTREMSSYGKRVVEEFVPSFVRSGMTVVSGLALGIDSQVAQSAINGGGKTVACLGHGLSTIFPKSNSRLAEEIVENGGLILSEFPLDQPTSKYTFPSRNRIIAGLSLGTVVIEAGEGSGALITADLALDYGREVFAVPGQIFDKNYIGCHQILTKGHAKLVTSPTDVLEEIGIVASEKTQISYEPADELEKVVISILSTMPQSVTDLVERSKLSAGDLNTKLTMLELAGAAKNVGGGMWVRQ
ncbi:DNA-processing protein DprA [Patescibacteria group bacterium]|nr:DNA-processing protein DprA [Patescibacteria group bacterium]